MVTWSYQTFAVNVILNLCYTIKIEYNKNSYSIYLCLIKRIKVNRVMKVTNKRHFAFLAGLLGTVQIILKYALQVTQLKLC